MQGSDRLYKPMAAQPMFKEATVDPDLEHKVKRASDKLSETVNIIANEPSLAFYRIQEHVRKILPQLVEEKHEVEDLQNKVQGACFDADYAINAVRTMLNSAMHFQNIQDLLKNAMFMKQQITYADNRRKFGRPSPTAGSSAAADRNSEVGSGGEAGQQGPGAGSLGASLSLDEKLNIPKISLEDSEGREVEQFMSKQTGSS